MSSDSKPDRDTSTHIVMAGEDRRAPCGWDIAIARQPILDPDWNLAGYELLYRAQPDGQQRSPEAMTASVLLNGLCDIGLDNLVGSHSAYLNVTRDFLLDVGPWELPPDRIVLELLENQRVDKRLLTVLGRAREQGFEIALDDFRHTTLGEPLLQLASIVKLDVLALTRWELIDEVEHLEDRGLRLIAEKVETAEQYELCREMGFDAYQGFFFQRPDLVVRRRIATRELSTLCSLVAVSAEATFEELEAIVRRDIGISHRLMRLANSAFVSPRQPVASLRQALMLLGTVTVRRWAMMAALAQLPDRPHVLVNTALVRARTAELIALASEPSDADRAFTVGLFSMLDVLAGAPMADLLSELPFDDRTSAALLDRAGPEGRLLQDVLAYERGRFGANSGDRPAALLARSYRDALRWADALSGQLAA